jgi:hypothetical protein
MMGGKERKREFKDAFPQIFSKLAKSIADYIAIK